MILPLLGGEKDIASVCRNDATCAGIESCISNGCDGYTCNFRFSIYLSRGCRKKTCKITTNINLTNTNQKVLI